MKTLADRLAEKLTEERELRQKVTKERNAAWERIDNLVDRLRRAEDVLESIAHTSDNTSSVEKALYYFKMKG
jgi:hypothetical protein